MAHLYPNEISDKLFDAIKRSRQIKLEKLQGDTRDIEEYKAHLDRVEPLPSALHLRDLLDAAFFSSLTEEEGQAATFTLVYADPTVAIESGWPRFCLSSPLPLTTEHIRKLSPAAPPGVVDIAVFQQKGELVIWGLLYLRRVTPGERSYPRGLTITALQTGLLSVRFSDKELLSYSRGDAVMPDPDESIDLVGLRQIIAKVFADERPFPEKYAIAATLLRFCNIALDSGSGATLLVVPEHHDMQDLDVPRYESDDISRKDLLAALSSYDQPHVTDAAANLLSIDGAVIYREGVGLLGAGAMIRAQKTPDFVVKIMPPHMLRATPIETTLQKFNGGARHRSALVFCQMNPGALAIVVSQDGVMSILVRPLEEDCVYAIRPIRRGTPLG